VSILNEKHTERVIPTRERFNWIEIFQTILRHPRLEHKAQRCVALYRRFELGRSWDDIAGDFCLLPECVEREALEANEEIAREKRRISQRVRRAAKSLSRGRKRPK